MATRVVMTTQPLLLAVHRLMGLLKNLPLRGRAPTRLSALLRS